MITNKYEERQVVQKVLVCTEVFCDICRNKIGRNKGYWRCHTYHDDWGNDSVESHEYFDICSIECLTKKFEEYCVMSSKSDYNTLQIEIEHTICTTI